MREGEEIAMGIMEDELVTEDSLYDKIEVEIT